MHNTTYFHFLVRLNCQRPSEKCRLFDTLAGSILNNSSEIWGMHEAKDNEKVHT